MSVVLEESIEPLTTQTSKTTAAVAPVASTDRGPERGRPLDAIWDFVAGLLWPTGVRYSSQANRVLGNDDGSRPRS
jgi:hypothetical protein